MSHKFFEKKIKTEGGTITIILSVEIEGEPHFSYKIMEQFLKSCKEDMKEEFHLPEWESLGKRSII